MALLTEFYNVRPYGQRRRGQGGLKIDIERPQLNMLVGTTPSNLMKFMPDDAWGMGFASRILFVLMNKDMELAAPSSAPSPTQDK